MTRSRLMDFCCTGDDILSIIVDVEARAKLQYVRMGLHDHETVTPLVSGNELPALGISHSGDRAQEPAYLVTTPGPTQVRSVPQNEGGVLFALDQVSNPDSLEFKPSGLYKNECLIVGRIATISVTPEALRLFEMFHKAIKRQCARIKVFWLGPEAMRLWKAGMRVATNARSSRAYDLTAS